MPITQRVIDGVKQDVVTLFPDFEGRGDNGGLRQPLPILMSDCGWGRVPGILVPEAFQRMNTEWGKAFWDNLPRAPRGVSAPWYLPVDEYDGWVELVGQDERRIADFVRFGLEINDVLAIQSAKMRISSPRKMKVMAEGWKIHHSARPDYCTDTPEGREEVSKLVSRMVFFHRDMPLPSRTARRPEASPYSMQMVAHLTDLIADEAGSDRFTDVTRDVFSLMKTSALVRMSRALALGEEECLVELQRDPEARTIMYDTTCNVIRRALLLVSNAHLSFDAKMSLMPLTAGPGVALREAALADHGDTKIGEVDMYGDLKGITAEAVDMLTSDDTAHALADAVTTAMTLTPNPTWPSVEWEELVEMAASGTPKEWMLASAFQPIPGFTPRKRGR